MSLTTSLSYNVKPAAVASRNKRASIMPSNGATFSGNSNAIIRIDIPTGVKGQYINTSQSYLKLRVRTDNDVSGNLDTSVYGLFSKMEVYHNGVLLESIDQYGALCNALIDLQVEIDNRNNDCDIMLGTTSTAANNGGSIGYGSITAFPSRFFCFPLVSGILGPQQEKYLPIGDMQGDLRLELTLDMYGMRLGTSAAEPTQGFNVSEVELMLDIVELDASVADTITRSNTSRENGVQFQISGSSWRNFSSVIPPSTGGSVLIPAKFTSLKNMITIQRDQAKVTKKNESSLSDRVGGSDFRSVQYRVGSNFVPSKPITDVVEAYVETNKSLHSLVIDKTGSLTFDLYKTHKFAQGIEFESLSHKSSVIQSGIDTRSILIYYEPLFTAARTYTTRVDTWCNHDFDLVIDGVGQARTFF